MKKIIRLTESDLTNLINRMVIEAENEGIIKVPMADRPGDELEPPAGKSLNFRNYVRQFMKTSEGMEALDFDAEDAINAFADFLTHRVAGTRGIFTSKKF